MQNVQFTLLSSLLLTLSVHCEVPCEAGDECTSSENLPGIIKLDVDCEYFNNLTMEQKQRYGYCGFIALRALICCPEQNGTAGYSVASQTSSDDYSCKRRLTPFGRITGGDEYQSKDNLEYPWLVGLHNRKTELFFCTGSLISNRHVLSAAHCFNKKGEAEATDAYHVMAMLGRFNVSDHDEAGSLNSLVWKIFIHPEWNVNSEDYDADISIVVLEDLIEFSAFIRPVCLPEASDKGEVNGDGTVVGWGHDNEATEQHEETPRKVKVTAVPFKDCALDANNLAPGLSRRTFCAGFNGRSTAPCTGDSGGGFYVEDGSSQKNLIEGIVSNSANQETPGVCKTDIYTIVANFVPWVKEKVEQTKERVVMDVEYTCSGDPNGYAECNQENYDNPLQNYARLKLRDYQDDPKGVRTLRFHFGEDRVIEGIGETFPNLEELENRINNPNRIERRIFANMTKLKKLRLDFTELILHHHFDDLVILEELRLKDCKMPLQPKNLFNVLRNLRTLTLDGGADWRILPDETLMGMTELEELTLKSVGVEEISENAFNDLTELKKLALGENAIEKLPTGMFKDFRALESIDLNYNKIEELPKDLFENNLMLLHINLGGNKIKRIEADFTLLPKIAKIQLYRNVCVDGDFLSERGDTVQGLQALVDRQCKQK